MFHAKDVLSDQLLANANEQSWYVPFSEAVKNLTEDEAFWKVHEESNSIAEIVQHLLYWNETWQTRYKEFSVHAVPKVGSNDSTFSIPKEKTFFEFQKQLLEVLLHWQEILTKKHLESDVQGFTDTKWWEVIGNVATHNAYHIGQIIYIRKLQKSWNQSIM
ncbi:DltD domain-containing protein [Bacillus sp. SA1-12]|uniref:DinB family protein n=1 Tax=Bacillus sp. SA1-12 TaxID=1455638 RepID=UPI0006272B53|nr:DinB family protein [Bacillus sp. SA1-12]KKI90013.1 DltD domain-containing protein [Bacillus sp. SA1-12]